MKLTRFLAFRLFLIILVVMVAGTAAITTINVNALSRQSMDSMLATAYRSSDIIKRSTYYSMLLNRREDISQIVRTIGTEPGISAIRIYNKKGTVSYSAQDSDVGLTVDLTSEACVACHSETTPPADLDPRELTRIFNAGTQNRILGMITPIHNEPACSDAPCHAHPPTQMVLGVLDVMLPLSEHDEILARTKRSQWTSALILVVAVTAVSGLFLYFMVKKPVHSLTIGTQEIIKGNLKYRIPLRRKDEIGQLAHSFNLMTDELGRAHDEIMRWTNTLEQRVTEKTRELRQAQRHVVQVEKMASLGKLSATVAHELNNPLEGVLTYAKLLKRKIKPGTLSPEAVGEIDSELSLIADESARCGAIVKNLLLFSRKRMGQLQMENFTAILNRTIQLVDHHFKMNNVKLVLNIPGEPVSIECDAQEIEQALVALEINAVEAMPEGGTLTIDVSRDEGEKELHFRVSDTGIGIPEEDIPHLFEPFFTTKEDGKGTGLGLAVVFGIVERHGGSVSVKSSVGKGTTFTVVLPLQQQNSTNGGDNAS